MDEVSIRSYRGEDHAQVVGLLRESLTADPVTESLFARRVLLDPNFDAEGAQVAKSEHAVVGFLLAIARRCPLEDGPDDSDRGYITLFAVAPRHRRGGIGGRLLERGLAYLRKRERICVLISPYAPNYWSPGVDVAAYPEAVAFLRARGFETLYQPISMDSSLASGWRVPAWAVEREAALAREGVRWEPLNPSRIPNLTDFLRAEFPGDWQRYVRQTMDDILVGRRASDDLLLAVKDGAILGFSQHEAERFGPFGVAESHRGRGIGAVLLFRTLETMRRKGHHGAWFLWTDDRTADRVYRAAGFRETRRYAVMQRRV